MENCEGFVVYRLEFKNCSTELLILAQLKAE